MAQREAVAVWHKQQKKNEYELKMKRYDSARRLHQRNVSAVREGAGKSRL